MVYSLLSYNPTEDLYNFTKKGSKKIVLSVPSQKINSYLGVPPHSFLKANNRFRSGIIAFQQEEFYSLVSEKPYPELYFLNPAQDAFYNYSGAIYLPEYSESYWLKGNLYADHAYTLIENHIPNKNKDEEEYIKYLLSQSLNIPDLEVKVRNIFYQTKESYRILTSDKKFINTSIYQADCLNKQLSKKLTKGEIFLSDANLGINLTGLIFRGKQATIYSGEVSKLSFRYTFKDEWGYYSDVIPGIPEPHGDRMFLYGTLCNELPIDGGGIAHPFALPRTLEDYIFGTLVPDPRHRLKLKEPPKKLLKL